MNKLSPMEKLVDAYNKRRPLRLTAVEVQQLIDRDGGLTNIVARFDKDDIDHEDFMKFNLPIMRGEES